MRKKILLFISCITILSSSLFGCGKQATTQNIIGNIKTNIDACTSMNYDIHTLIDTKQKYEETNINTKIEYKLNVETTKTLSHITGDVLTTIKDSDNKYEVDMWQTIENENNLLYYKKNDTWYRQDSDNKNNLNMNLLKAIYNQNPAIEKETTILNDKECYAVNAQLSGEILQEYISLFGDIQLSEEDNVGIILYTYKDLDYPAYLKIDLKNIANNIVSETTELTYSFNEYYIEITFNSFNSSDISLPEEIKNNALKEEYETPIIQEPESTETTEVIESTETTEIETETETSESSQTYNESSESSEIGETSDLSDSWNAFQYQYNSNVYRLPMSYKTMESSGYLLKEEEKSKVLEGSQSYSTTLYNGENQILVKMENTTTSPKTLKECDITSIDLDTYSLTTDELSKFMFNGKINFSYTYQEVLDTYGEATNIHDGVALKIITYQDGDNYIELYFDPDTLTIIELKMFAK